LRSVIVREYKLLNVGDNHNEEDDANDVRHLQVRLVGVQMRYASSEVVLLWSFIAFYAFRHLIDHHRRQNETSRPRILMGMSLTSLTGNLIWRSKKRSHLLKGMWRNLMALMKLLIVLSEQNKLHHNQPL